ncbi:MAG: NADP-dependent aldehyde dehydrogenase [Cyclobacteriaceae bacterium]|nr:MAG: NADP-dependent aldehyde dehydrogenase [Cyclobacteriaceae bacterium]
MSVKEIFESMKYGPATESSETAHEWIKGHQKFKFYIDGKWQTPLSKKYFDSINPCTRQPLAQIPWGGKADVNKSVKAARKALPGWSKTSPHQRARYLYAIARQIQKNARLFSVLESLDNGKTIRESRDIDIPLAARHFYHHAGWAQLMDSELKDYQEIGVVGQIIPWNFPLLMLAWKVAPAIAMGNTVVLKPAEYTSLTAFLFAEICHQVNLPAGVVNIISGDGETGSFLVEHPEINKIAFTGSTEVGRIIRQKTAGSEKKISLELGGKSPFLVFEDADLDSVVEGIVDAIWFNQGQVCCAGSRLLVQEGIAKKLYGKIRARMEKLRVGDSLDKANDIGAIVAPEQLETITRLVKQGVEEGATLWQPSWACPTDGYFYPPTLFTEVAPASTISQQEIFGPVLVAMTFRTHQEAVKLANNTRYGLSASIWTENINLALEVAPRIKAGTVWNNCTNVFDAASGFGGYRESGFGREGGKEGLFEYLKPKIENQFAAKPVYYSSKSNSAQSAVGSQESDKLNLADSTPSPYAETGEPLSPAIDRTAKLYIGGKQVRPDGGYSMPVYNQQRLIGQVGLGNRKDIRNAVESAHKASSSWAEKTGHHRAQVLYYLAENLQAREQEFASRIRLMTGVKQKDAQEEINLSIQRIFYYAAQADKYDGQVHSTIYRNVTLAMPEPIGVMGVICPDEFPLLGLISTVMPVITMGNTAVVIPSERWPLSATDLYQVLETSDLPGGVINIITGKKAELLPTVAAHDDVEGLWYFGDQAGSKQVEELSAENMKRTWVSRGRYRDWRKQEQGAGAEFLRQATQVKNIWIPYGE